MSYRDHKCDILKVAAQDLQLGSGCGQGWLLYALHQHVEYPGFEINKKTNHTFIWGYKQLFQGWFKWSQRPLENDLTHLSYRNRTINVTQCYYDIKVQ